MTPEEKAKELINKFKSNLRADNRSWEFEYKQCALICVDEIAEALPYNQIPKLIFWSEVKEEIENL